MKLVHNSHEYRNGVKYDPATFKKPTKQPVVLRDIPRMDVIAKAIWDNGFAIIPASHREAIRNRAKRQDYNWSFCKLDDRRVRVTPKKG